MRVLAFLFFSLLIQSFLFAQYLIDEVYEFPGRNLSGSEIVYMEDGYGIVCELNPLIPGIEGPIERAIQTYNNSNDTDVADFSQIEASEI